jgi:hypothetical protein
VSVVRLVVALLCALACAWAVQAVRSDLATARDLHGAPYAGAAQCARCHPDHARSFGRTFHRTMTQAASEESVRAPFDGAQLDYFGVRARASRGQHGEFVIEYQGDAIPRTRFVVDKTIGSRRYQQYVAERAGELVRLPIAYHIEEQRWFHMNGAFLTPDPEPAGALERADYERHVTRWNDNCIFCHNVAPNPGKRSAADGAEHFETEVAELGVACEACHGPGLAHTRANTDPLRRYALHLSGARDPSIVNPARLSQERALDVCGRCHGQRLTDDVEAFLRRGDPFVAGDDLALYSAPLWRDSTLHGEHAFANRFWSDGTPRLTANEYQGVLQSPCAQRGELSCLSCHGMHEGDPRGQLRPDKLGAAQCTQCHTPLASSAAQRAHDHHPAQAASCVDCHMPNVVYGVLDVHPSHRIELPDPARAAAAGRPDACTLCHVERTRAWAAEQRAALWGGADSAPAPAASAWSEVETQLYAGDPVERALAAHALGRRAAQPSFARARTRALRHPAALLLEVLLHDPYPAVRHLALRSLRRAPGVAAQLRGFVPELDPGARARALAAVRGRFALSAQDAAHADALREQARALAIDIGE